ncbi:hypothetical protein LIER_11308 [Lithospermum erythrorhizon]|uniref:BED-type domain-containing protein n=1 Tax=Lithospermum erythrorhizon TaxID=34254 RepID=A0AAV3PMK6_LITER
MLSASTQSNGSPSDDQRRRQLVTVSSIREAENGLDVDDLSLSTGDKRKREGKPRSRVWQHFTKLIKEDGSCEKCKCNHCLRLFTCSSRSGTTHLLRHITEGICPAYNNKDRTDHWPAPSSDDQDFDPDLVDDYRKAPRRADTFMNDLRACASKLVELTNQSLIPTSPDYSLAAAVKCLNDLDDIPQSSEMYLDAFEFLKDAAERECFICLSPEPRRRWLQRMLQRRYPSRYAYHTD